VNVAEALRDHLRQVDELMSLARDEFDRLAAEYLDGWTFEVSARMTSAAGYCYHEDKVIRIAEWLMLIGTKAEILDVVRHEVAHAMAGHEAHHGRVWKVACLIVGADPSRTYPIELLRKRLSAQRHR
jgi:predicted SprT family Zn-dependent metalloprotease